ncbi:hypothetical protein BY996DRAFT_7008326 [Phakopsora pachyrhizi]|nr:hypothetical protein BY996DRAFT_7008326 [Phakopsora pachyrhizi]
MAKKRLKLYQALAKAQPRKKLNSTVKDLKSDQANQSERRLKKVHNSTNQSNKSLSDKTGYSSDIIKFREEDVIRGRRIDDDGVEVSNGTIGARIDWEVEDEDFKKSDLVESLEKKLISQSIDSRNNRNKSSHHLDCDRCMVRPGQKILLVGEGNFSFSVSLVVYHSIPGESITATTIDSRSKVLSKYSDASKFLNVLENHKVNVIFELDCTRLEKDKRIKSLKPFDRVIFNFPHLGLSEADMDRNIRSNQILLLKFFRSVSGVLFKSSSVSNNHPNSSHRNSSKSFDEDSKNSKKKRKRKLSVNKFNCDSSDDESVESVDDHRSANGTVLITLGDKPPYSLWQLPQLAKKGPILVHSILYPNQPQNFSNSNPQQQPSFNVLRSFEFKSNLYPMYHHCKTVGSRKIFNSLSNVTHQSKKESFSGDEGKIHLEKFEDSQPDKPRTWEFELTSNN